ncbi:multiple epidermal growth factor-like domains protein 10 [Trichonephila clavipes]|nr:multiple epidermal growth factor-like domains protein 10 [Trichonephila clavipes]
MPKLWSCNKTCDNGFWGANCSQVCKCKNGAECDSVTGFCKCSPGWMAADCGIPCSLNTYGENCSQECTCGNNSVCNHIDGTCNCSSGYFGNVCDQVCKKELWGVNCGNKCKCLNEGKCSPFNGTCICPLGFIGSRCESICNPGFFGINCSNKCECSSDCSCHHVDGTCSCEPEKIEVNCNVTFDDKICSHHNCSCPLTFENHTIEECPCNTTNFTTADEEVNESKVYIRSLIIFIIAVASAIFILILLLPFVIRHRKRLKESELPMITRASISSLSYFPEKIEKGCDLYCTNYIRREFSVKKSQIESSSRIEDFMSLKKSQNFQRLHRQLRETRLAHVTRHDAGRRRAIGSPRLEESILNVVAD